MSSDEGRSRRREVLGSTAAAAARRERLTELSLFPSRATCFSFSLDAGRFSWLLLAFNDDLALPPLTVSDTASRVLLPLARMATVDDTTAETESSAGLRSESVL